MRAASDGAKQRCRRLAVADAAVIEVLVEEAEEIVTDGYLADLATFFVKPEVVLVTVSVEVGASEPGNRADTGAV